MRRCQLFSHVAVGTAVLRSAAKAAVNGQELRGCFLIFAIKNDRKNQ